MMDIFESCFEALMKFEGGYSNNPADSGGATNWGITQKVAQAHGFTGDMRDLTQSLAAAIYKSDYWDRLLLDDIAQITNSKALCYSLFDFCVNSGTGKAAKYLQRALNVMNNKQEYYNDISVDGFIGPATLSALSEFINHRDTEGVDILAAFIQMMRAAFVVEIAENRESQEVFTYGLIKRVFEVIRMNGYE